MFLVQAVMLVLLALGSPTKAIFDFGDNAAGPMFFMLKGLDERIHALETQMGTMAAKSPDGCESGVIGPFHAGQNSGTITFRGKFDHAPAISLSLSDLTSKDANLPLNFQIRPKQVSTTEAQVELTDTNNNVAGAYIAYMACPNNKRSGGGGGDNGPGNVV